MNEFVLQFEHIYISVDCAFNQTIDHVLNGVYCESVWQQSFPLRVQLRSLVLKVDFIVIYFVIDVQIFGVESAHVRLFNCILDFFLQISHHVILFKYHVNDEVVQAQVRALEILVHQVQK